MKNRVILTLLLLATLTACSPQGTPQNTTPNSQLSEIGGDAFTYNGDGSDLLSVVSDRTGKRVLITPEGNEVLDLDIGYPIGEGLLYVPGTGGITLEGKNVFPDKFEHLGMFVNGLAPAGEISPSDKQVKYGFINPAGTYVINPVYWGASEYSEGYAAVAIDEEESGFIDASGNLVYRGFGSTKPFSEGLAVVSDLETGLYGYIGLDGRYVIEPAYQAARPFSEGLAAVALPSEKLEERQFGYIDKKGAFILEASYGSAGEFWGGIAAVTYGDLYDGTYHFIDTAGKEVFDSIYDVAFAIKRAGAGVFQVCKPGGNMFFMHSDGNRALERFSPSNL